MLQNQKKIQLIFGIKIIAKIRFFFRIIKQDLIKFSWKTDLKIEQWYLESNQIFPVNKKKKERLLKNPPLLVQCSFTMEMIMALHSHLLF